MKLIRLMEWSKKNFTNVFLCKVVEGGGGRGGGVQFPDSLLGGVVCLTCC